MPDGQLARRNLTDFSRAELVLKLKPEIAAEAKARMVAGVADPTQKSAEGRAPQTRDTLASLAGVSHDTIAKVERRGGLIREALGKAKGTRGQPLLPGPGRGIKEKTGSAKSAAPVSDKKPTSKELGITEKTSARMTKLAKVERRGGLIREALGKAEGTRGQLAGRDLSGVAKTAAPEKRNDKPTSKELGITEKTSARMTKLAKVEIAAIEKAVAQANYSGEELSLPKLVDAVEDYLARGRQPAAPGALAGKG